MPYVNGIQTRHRIQKKFVAYEKKNVVSDWESNPESPDEMLPFCYKGRCSDELCRLLMTLYLNWISI